MAVTKVKFAEHNDENIYLYTLTNKNGLSAEILNFGCIIKRLVYKNTDVVLGKDTFEEYLNDNDYLGATIGRNSHSIEDSEFEYCGTTYKLSANSGNNNHHGGIEGFNKKIWQAQIIDQDEPSLLLSRTSPDGEEGFPGNVKVQVTFTLTNDNSLKIHYLGECDKDTVLNMTNHSYFNLNGHSNGNIYGHSLWIDSDLYMPTNNQLLPYGEIQSVNNTPFDFRKEIVLEQMLKSEHEQIAKNHGFDNYFIFNDAGFKTVARLKGEKSGIVMELSTDRQGLLLYTANELSDNFKGKDKAIYFPHSAICLETQTYPNALKYPHLPCGILKKGEKYNSITSYKFI